MIVIMIFFYARKGLVKQRIDLFWKALPILPPPSFELNESFIVYDLTLHFFHYFVQFTEGWYLNLANPITLVHIQAIIFQPKVTTEQFHAVHLFCQLGTVLTKDPLHKSDRNLIIIISPPMYQYYTSVSVINMPK